jgi:hypothetical protein
MEKFGVKATTQLIFVRVGAGRSSRSRSITTEAKAVRRLPTVQDRPTGPYFKTEIQPNRAHIHDVFHFGNLVDLSPSREPFL